MRVLSSTMAQLVKILMVPSVLDCTFCMTHKQHREAFKWHCACGLFCWKLPYWPRAADMSLSQSHIIIWLYAVATKPVQRPHDCALRSRSFLDITWFWHLIKPAFKLKFILGHMRFRTRHTPQGSPCVVPSWQTVLAGVHHMICDWRKCIQALWAHHYCLYQFYGLPSTNINISHWMLDCMLLASFQAGKSPCSQSGQMICSNAMHTTLMRCVTWGHGYSGRWLSQQLSHIRDNTGRGIEGIC